MLRNELIPTAHRDDKASAGCQHGPRSTLDHVSVWRGTSGYDSGGPGSFPIHSTASLMNAWAFGSSKPYQTLETSPLGEMRRNRGVPGRRSVEVKRPVGSSYI